MMILSVSKGRTHVCDVPIDRDELFLGRGDDVNVMLEGDAVSRRHARVYRSGDQVIAEDVSANGMFVNGQPTKACALKVGDRIEIAQYIIELRKSKAMDRLLEAANAGEGHALAALAARGYGATGPVGPAAMQPGAAAGEKPTQNPTAFLELGELQRVRDGVAKRRQAHLACIVGGTRHEHVLGQQASLIGWADDCHIRLPGSKLFAKYAATVAPTPDGQHRLEGLSFWRKIYLGDRRIKAHFLRDGDVFDVAGIRFKYNAAVD